jgi:predicted nucleotidyltransferase
MFKNNGRKKMRLEKDQIEVLKNKLSELSSNAKLYLFGSRIDDTKKGGDIDLLVVVKKRVLVISY